jgi:hypothetical protein
MTVDRARLADTSMTDLWHSAFRPAFEAVVAEDLPPAVAVEKMYEYCDDERCAQPSIYVSTALTSAGHRRESDLKPASGIPQAVERNSRTASLILSALASNQASIVSQSSVMVPSDLGHVPSWKDCDYLVFYFAWMSGLSAEGASRLDRELNKPQYQTLRVRADNRTADNEIRWPSYEAFTEVALAKLLVIEASPGTVQAGGARILLQLVDVGESLGCRAETLFAQARSLDIVTPTFAHETSGVLGEDVTRLIELGATVGAPRTGVELTSVQLRR